MDKLCITTSLKGEELEANSVPTRLVSVISNLDLTKWATI